MKGKRFTEEKIKSILKEHESGVKVPDLVRKNNVSEQGIYRWKSKFGGMTSSNFAYLDVVDFDNRPTGLGVCKLTL